MTMDSEKRAVRFRIALEDGYVVCGVVHGAFGVLGEGCSGSNQARKASGALARLRAARDLAEAGKPHALYEPLPGCVKVYPDYSAHGFGREVIVSLVGACVSVERFQVRP